LATYAVGDIQGCHRTLGRLLERLRFDPAGDRLWLVGDLVNRGPGSLDVLRWAKGLGTAATIVLGNHDLHLLARAAGVGIPRKRDTLDDVLAAPDVADLVDWLRRRPLLHREDPFVLVHAGLLPGWTVAEAERLAREGEAVLRGPGGEELLSALEEGRMGAAPAPAAAVSALTSLRLCDATGRPDDGFTGPPVAAPAGRVPWFAVPRRRSSGSTVVFGHWAALGLLNLPDLVALDTGCVWGGSLTAVRLDDRRVFQEPCAEPPVARKGR
jgi:bis(5'-nucleosyl)-tetraphosphatase (symmetrical)